MKKVKSILAVKLAALLCACGFAFSAWADAGASLTPSDEKMTPDEFKTAVAGEVTYDGQGVTVDFSDEPGNNNHSDGKQFYVLGGYNPMRSQPITVRNVKFYSSDKAQLYLYTTANVTFENCVFENVGVSMHGVAYDSKATALGTFTNCTFKNFDEYAIKYVYNVVVSGCRFDNCERALLIGYQPKAPETPVEVSKVIIDGCEFSNLKAKRIVKFYDIEPVWDENTVTSMMSITNNKVEDSCTAGFIQIEYDTVNGGASLSASNYTYRFYFVGNTGITQVNVNDVANTKKPLYIDGDYLVDVEPVAVTYVAQIGETKYESLAAAVDAAQDGDTIELLSNVVWDGSGAYYNLDVEGSVTIDGKGYTLSAPASGGPSNSAIMLGDSSSSGSSSVYTITNVTFSGFTSISHSVLRAQGVTAKVVDCTFTGNASSGGEWGVVTANNGADVTVKDCVFRGNTGTKCVDVGFNVATGSSLAVDNCLFENNNLTGHGVIYVAGGITAATIRDSSFSGNTVLSPEPDPNDAKPNAAIVYCSGVTDITGCLFTNNTVKAYGKEGVVVLGSTAENASVTGNAFVDNTLSTERNPAHYATLYVSKTCNLSGNYWGDGAAPAEADQQDIYNSGTQTPTIDTYATNYTVVGNGVTVTLYVPPVAEAYDAEGGTLIGQFATVNDAIAAAGATYVKLLDNVTLTAPLTMTNSSSYTLDFDGKTIYYNTTATTLINGSSNIIFKNGKLDISGCAISSSTDQGLLIFKFYPDGNILTFDKMELYGKNCRTYGIFTFYNSTNGSTVNFINGSRIAIENESNLDYNDIFKGLGTTYPYVINITDSTVSCTNVTRFSLYGTVNVKNSTVTFTGGMNAFRQGAFTFDNSTVTVSGAKANEGRGISPRFSDTVVKNGSVLTFIGSNTGRDVHFEYANNIVIYDTSTVTAASVSGAAADRAIVAPANYILVTTDNGDSSVTYSVAPAVAQIGDEKYATFSDAIAAAETYKTEHGEYPTITVLNGATEQENTRWSIVDGYLVRNYFYQDASDANLWHIENLEGLKAFRDSVNGGEKYTGKTIQLDADIDLSLDVDANSQQISWVPIGRNAPNSRPAKDTSSTRFEGTFNGNNHTISNLYINDSNLIGAGLFGIAQSGEIKNLTLNNVDITAKSFIGSVVGFSYSNINNCDVTGTIDIDGHYMQGGVVGQSYNSISGCDVNGTSKAASHVISTYFGDDLEADKVGGIVGHWADGSVVSISNCSVRNLSVAGSRDVGGMIGWTQSYITMSGCSVSNLTITANTPLDYAQSKSTKIHLGGVFGSLYNDDSRGSIQVAVQDIALCVATPGVETIAKMGYVSGGKYSADPMAGPSNPTNAGIVVTGTNSSQGIQSCNNVFVQAPGVPVATVTISGVATNYGDLHDALEAGKAKGAVVTLLKDVDLAGVNWVPVGDATAFNGTFDGQNHIIGNLSSSGTENVGLFGHAVGATIRNVTISNVTLSASSSHVGALIGHGDCFTASNCVVIGTINISGSSNAGGLVGTASNAQWAFRNCLVDGTSANTSTVSSSNMVGGLVGNTDYEGVVSDCTVKNVTVRGPKKVGGLIGQFNYDNDANHNDPSDLVSVSGTKVESVTVDCTATTQTDDYVQIGGLFGILYRADSASDFASVSITATLKNVTVNGIEASAKGAANAGIVSGGYRKKTVADSQTQLADDNVVFNITFEGTNAVTGNTNYSDYIGIYNPAPYVAQIGETKYETLQAAFEAAQSGDTIELLADVDLGTTGLVIGEDKNFTLDIGEYNITGTVNGKLITNNGTLVINGTTGCVYNQDISAQGHDALLNNGTVTINGGWFGDSDNDKANANAFNRGAGFRNFGTATINGGHFTACDNFTNGGYAYAIINGDGENNPTLTINNADVYGKNNGNLATNSGTITVKGGTYDISGTKSHYSLYSYSGNTVVVGGTFTKSGNNNGQFCVEVDNDNVNNPGSITVSGGSFSAAVPAKYCAEGVLPVSEADPETGLYTVRPANYVAQIGSAKYESLADAFAAVVDGDTITMLANSTEAAEPVLAINGGVTLDLNGKTVTANNDIWVKTGSLTVVGSAGSAINSTGYAFYVSTQSIPNNVATLTINSNDVTIHGDVYGIAVMSGGVVNLQAGSVTSTVNPAICNNGSNQANTTINITGGTVSSDSTAIYHPGPGTLTVGLSSCDGDDGHSHPVIAGKTGVEMRAGTLNVYCGDITATATEFAANANGSGPTIAGAAIAVSQHTTDKMISVNISGGVLNGIYGVYEKDLQNPDTGSDVEIVVTGGEISGTTSSIVISDIDSTTESVSAAISGGYFSSKVPQSYLAEGKLCTTKANFDHLYQVVDKCTVTFNKGTTELVVTLPGTINYPAGDLAKRPLPDPTYTSENTTFAGWQMTVDNETKIVSELPAGTTGNVELTATWTTATPVTVDATTTTGNEVIALKVTDTWLQANQITTGTSESDVAARKAALEAEDATTGLKKWQNYVLGQDTTKSASVVAAKDSVEETKAELDMTFNVPAVDTGFDVKYRVDKVVGETVTEGAVNSVAEIDLDAATTSKASAFFQVKAVLTPKGSTDSTKDVVVDVQKTVGVVKVDSAAEWTIVAVPWESLADGEDIKASELIHLGNRSNGDELRVYQSGTYQTYELVNGEWTGDAAQFTANNDNTSSQQDPQAANVVTIPRGAGVWLKRVDPTAPIYLLGQKPTEPSQASETVKTTLEPAASATEPTWNLLASPALEPVKISDVVPEGSTGDAILIPSETIPKKYTYEEGKGWGYEGVVETYTFWVNGVQVSVPEVGHVVDTDAKLPAAKGFWYINSSTDSNRQIDWENKSPNN